MTVTFRTDFPGGNGLLLESAANGEKTQVRFAAEPKNCPEAMWFYIRLAGLAGRATRLTLANPEQTLGGVNWSGNRPVFRRLIDGAWTPWGRTSPPQAVAVDGRVEWAWELPPAAELEWAHCYPYLPTDLDATLAELSGAFKSTMLGLTYANRPLPRVFNRLAQKERPAVFITARHHAGETPGSWVLDGLLRQVAAQPRLQAIVWWAVPFVDLDDVLIGSFGKDPYPHDCNRAYGHAGPRRPEAAAVWADVQRLKDASSKLLFLDLHAPSHFEQTVYVPRRGWDPEAPISPIAEDFANRYNQAQPEDIRSPVAHITPAASSESRHSGYSASRWASEIMGLEAVTIETSYQGNGRKAYEIDDYRRLGAALADVAGDWVLRRR